ncbi:MAG: SRPBCC family protein [Candidatus Binatia bacterium]
MKRSSFMGLLLVSLALSFVAACEEKPSIDWSAKENLVAHESVGKNDDDSVRLEFHSLVDAPADAVYQALAEPENYSVFVRGVTDSGKISGEGNSRVIHITQNVIGRQTRAKTKYTFHPDKKTIDFKTLESDTTFTEGSYEIVPSDDGKRSYVISIFNVREKSGQKMPPGVVVSGTRESFLEAARSVKARALGENLKTKTG